ncbi:MAG: nucleoside 2-deoxyribosyltransferase domain-containing protein [Patescibacteria group bacterium]|jgi:hypothetical protein
MSEKYGFTIVHGQESFPEQVIKSVFLAGPIPRDEKGLSWKFGAFAILESLGFSGTVYDPEKKGGGFRKDVNRQAQIDWEDEGLNRADVILFWIPRELKHMPALTTNVEFGEWMKSGKVVLGAPENAARMKYLLEKAVKYKIPTANTLKKTIELALGMLGRGALRTGGECQVPLHIWQTKAFQYWYHLRKRAGNELRGCRVLYNNFFAKHKPIWLIRPQVYVPEENQIKGAELVAGRSSACSNLYYLPEDDDTIFPEVLF